MKLMAVCPDLRIKAGKGPKEAMKAKAILAPADNDGLEAVFYNFCGVGHSEMDNKGAGICS